MLNNGKLTAVAADGIEAHEIARCLNDWRTDTNGRLENSILCTSPKINIWAKCKPIRYYDNDGGTLHVVPRKLTDVERRGMLSEITSGYYWGIKMTRPTDDWINLHSTEVDYHRPRGANAPDGPELFRVADFDGYNHYARPTMFGQVTGAYLDADQALMVTIATEFGGNTDGVDIAEILFDATDERSRYEKIGKLYPCIFITTPSGRSYAHGLYVDGVLTPTVGPLCDAQGTYRRSWFIDFKDFDKEVLVNGTYRCTVFLTTSQVFASQIGGFTLRDWQEIRDDVIMTAAAAPLPMATGIDLALKSTGTDYTPRFISSSPIYATTTYFQIYANVVETVTTNVSLLCEIKGVTKEIVISPGTPVSPFRFLWSDFSYPELAPGYTENITVTLRCRNAWISQTFKVIVQ